MELSDFQIKSLFEFTENNGVHYYDVQVELVDHLATEIEADMETNGTLTFPEALNRAFDSFGLNGFEDVLQEKKEAVNAQHNKMVFDEVKQWFTLQRFTLILTVGLTNYFLWIVFDPLVRMCIVWAGSLILALYQFIDISKNKLTKRLLLFEDNAFGIWFIIVIIFPIVFSPLIIYYSWYVETMVNIVLVLFVLQVITFNLERRLEKQIQTLYPEAYESKATKEDIQKQKAWNTETPSLYEQTLCEAPPADLWPQTVEQPEEIKPFRLQPKLSSKLLFLFLLATTICYLLSYFNAFRFPFNFTRGESLLYYALLGGVVASAYRQFLVREKTAVAAFVHTYFPPQVNAFQMAHFLYGPERAIQTAIVDLVDKGEIEVKDNETMVVTKHGRLRTGENPLYTRLSREKEGAEINLKNVITTCYNEKGFDHPQLQKMQKLLNVFSVEETLPILFVLIGIVHIAHGRQLEQLFVLLFLLVFFGAPFYAIRRDVLSRKNSARESAKRKYVAETDLLKSEAVDPVKRFAIQSNPSLIAFSQPARLNSILLQVQQNGASTCDISGVDYVRNFEGASGSGVYGGDA